MRKLKREAQGIGGKTEERKKSPEEIQGEGIGKGRGDEGQGQDKQGDAITEGRGEGEKRKRCKKKCQKWNGRENEKDSVVDKKKFLWCRQELSFLSLACAESHFLLRNSRGSHTHTYTYINFDTVMACNAFCVCLCERLSDSTFVPLLDV